MALISFGYRIDMFAIDPPTEVGSYIVAYDLDGALKQKDHLGVVTLVGSGAGGPQGPPGPVGPAGLTWSGYWVATQSYSENYAVGYGSASWWCISAVTGSSSNPSPDVDTTHWTLLAAQGSPGSQGGTGSPGLQGPQGPIGINWIGDWIINVYDVRDAVYYNGSSYVCIASTVGTETLSPDTNTACWDIISLKGDVGPQGATGSPGVSGATGSTLQDIFYNIGGTVSATNSTSSIYRTGPLSIGTGTASDSRFLVSSSGGTISLVVDNSGKVLLFGTNSTNANTGLNIIGINSTSYGGNNTNPAIINFIPNPNDYPVDNAVSGIQSQDFNAGNVRAGIYFQSEVGNAGRPAIVFRTGSFLTERMRISQAGNIGIGTASPSTKLHVYATQSGAFRLEDGTQGNNYILTSDSNGVATWTPLSSIGISGASGSVPKFTGTSSLGNSRFYEIGTAGYYGSGSSYVSFLPAGNTWLTLNRSQSSMNFILGNPQSPHLQIGQIQSTNTIGLSVESAGYTSFNTGPTYLEKMRITSGGNVGIGLTAPSTTLHIYATQSGAFRLEDGTQGNNYILTSDSNGVATWTASIYATDSNVVHKTGNETITGIKTFYNTGVLTNVVVQNYNTNTASSALESINGNAGIGIKSENTSSGIGIYSNSTSTGLNYVGANSGVITFSVNKTGDVYASSSVSIGTGTASNSRFLVSSSGGTNSLVINEEGDAIFRGDTKIIGKTFSNLPPGSITFGGKTAIYSPTSREIIIGTDMESGYSYNYGWKFTDYKITNLWGNPIEVQNTMGTIGNLWIGSSYTIAGYGSPVSQQSTLFVKGTTSSIMKVVGTGATWSNSGSIFLVEDSGKVSIGPTFSSAFSNSRLDINVGSFLFGVHTNGNYVTSKGGGKYAFADGSTGMHDAGANNIKFISYGTGDAFKFEPQYTTSNYSVSPNTIQRIILQEYPISASSSNTQIRMIELSPTINKTGTASGIDRGIYIKPTLTNDLNKFRSIEVTDGEVMFNTLGGYVNIGSTQSISGAKLFIQSSTSSTTIGSNVMLDLYNGDTGTFDSISEIAFSQNGQPGALSPYGVGHRYALITGYAITGNNAVSTGGIKFSTRALTGASLVTALVVAPNGSVYNEARGSNTLYGLNALLVSTGINNTAIGSSALQNNLGGLNNTAVGLSSMASNTSGNYNTAVGAQALTLSVSGSDNVAIGIGSQQFATQSSSNVSVGRATLYNNLSSGSVAIGSYALTTNTLGLYNTAVGTNALTSNSTAVSAISITNGGSGYTMSSTFSNVQLSYISGSTATTYPTVTIYVGVGGTVSTATLVTNGTGFKDTTTVMGANLGTGVTFSVSVSSLNSGDYNTAIGYNSLYSNRTGANNTALGYNSLYSNTTGDNNVALGYQSLYSNTTGIRNTAIGFNSLQNNTTGNHNTAIGYYPLSSNTTGYENTAIGYFSLLLNTTGHTNTAIGYFSLSENKTGQSNTAVGYQAGYLISGSFSGATNSSNSVFIGYDTRPQADGQTNQIVIGYTASGNGSNSVTLGNDSITKTILKGNVGIGVTGPSTSLHIYKNTSGALRLEDGTQGNGYILTSDTNGVASWSSTVAVITTTSSITTNTLDNNGLSQINKCVIIDNGTYSISLTVDTTSGFNSTYLKHGTASISFVQGSGRTLIQVDGTLVLNGSVGSSATIISYGTTDYLRVNNA